MMNMKGRVFGDRLLGCSGALDLGPAAPASTSSATAPPPTTGTVSPDALVPGRGLPKPVVTA
jgi:hypothetical protein